MKYYRILIILLILLTLTACMVASAHPGRTDSNGGHYDRSTGEYHYHHGYPAHQHENGVCPYDYDDKTGERSGSSSSGTRSLPPVEPATDSPTAQPEVTEEKDEESHTYSEYIQNRLKDENRKTWITFIIVISVLFGPYLLLAVIGLISDRPRKK